LENRLVTKIANVPQESFHDSLDLSLGFSELLEEMRKDRDTLLLDKSGMVSSQTAETDVSYDIEVHVHTLYSLDSFILTMVLEDYEHQGG